MKPEDRDISTLRHIVSYCDEIIEAVKKHSLTQERVATDALYKNALSMSILQIGELAGVLSEEFRLMHGSIPWREIKRMRDKAAHHYWKFDVDVLWETVTEEIEPLKAYCEACIKEYEAMT